MTIQVPLLFLGDAPSIPGGLSRIGRDLAQLAVKMEEFRVGFLGRGGVPTRKLPFMQYNFPESAQWGEGYLQDVWTDFAGDEKGILFSIWDPSRLLWLADPIGMPNEEWMRNPPFVKWGYFPIDATGPGGRLTTVSSVVLQKYDRVLAYGEWGSKVAEASTGKPVDWIPHGINMETFCLRDAHEIRESMGHTHEAGPLILCVMTNQTRKDWGLTFDILVQLKHYVPTFKAWLKSDSIDRHWDFRALIADYGLSEQVFLDLEPMTDTQLSYLYSAADVTILPSLGEGFGYPIVESLACGTPCIHGDYAGGAELVPKRKWLVRPTGWRLETRHNCVRPVYDSINWVEAVLRVLNEGKDKEYCRTSVTHLDWTNLYTVWQRWLREGLK